MDSCGHRGPVLAAGVYMCVGVLKSSIARAQKFNDVASAPLTPSSLPSSRPNIMQERALDDYTQKRTHIFALVARIGTHWLARTRSRRTQVRPLLQSSIRIFVCCMYIYMYVSVCLYMYQLLYVLDERIDP